MKRVCVCVRVLLSFFPPGDTVDDCTRCGEGLRFRMSVLRRKVAVRAREAVAWNYKLGAGTPIPYLALLIYM